QKQKEKTLKALLARVEGLATRQPVMMLVEDAHWMDLTSRESFDIIIDRVPSLPVLLIITYRPEFMPPWVGRPRVTPQSSIASTTSRDDWTRNGWKGVTQGDRRSNQ